MSQQVFSRGFNSLLYVSLAFFLSCHASVLPSWRCLSQHAGCRFKGPRKNATTDLVIPVPPGTLVKKKRSGQLLGELLVPGAHVWQAHASSPRTTICSIRPASST